MIISLEQTRAAQIQHSLEQACLCAKTAEDYRCKDTLVLELSAITPVVDYFVLTTGTSPRQMHAVADEIARVLKADGSATLGREGYEAASWILQDFGDVVLHVFTPQTREIYALERLWSDAPRIDWRAVVERAKSG